MPINPKHATFYTECERCQEKFWDEDVTAYLTETEIEGELVTVCRSCLPKIKAEERAKEKAAKDTHKKEADKIIAIFKEHEQ